MNQIEALLRRYDRFVRVPWEPGLAGPQKVWFVIYDQDQERRLRLRVEEFEHATTQAGHGWHLVDVTDGFGRWMAGQEYRDAYFEEPEYLADKMPEFTAFVAARIEATLAAPGADDDAVVAVLGVGALFGLTRVSALIESVAPKIRGRLLVFFPGSFDGASYRLLDARDGWNYRAVPITAGQADQGA